MSKMLMRAGVTLLMIAVFVGLTTRVEANRYTSPNYTIDASISNSFGGSTTGGSYQLTGSGGESIIGNGAGGSYILDQGYVAQLDNALQLTVQPAGQVAYYPLDEKTGTRVADYSSSANNGTVSSVTRPSGRVDGAYQFDGTAGSLVSVTDANSLDMTGDFTVSTWLQPSVATQTVGSKVLTKANNYTLAYDSAGQKIQATVYCSGATNVLSTTNLTSTITWYHVALTRVGNILRVYVNGVSQNQATCGTLGVAANTPLEIGNSATSPIGYRGKLDEVTLYNRGLGALEIEALYDAGSSGQGSGVAFSNTITPGISQTASVEAIIQTDAPGYTLALNQNQNLTSGSNTIPAVSGSIPSPLAWSEGTTKGLGVSVVSSNATAPDSKWSSGNAYAALPAASTTVYSRSGFSGGAKDIVTIRYRIDVAANQTTGKYTNTVTYTGTMLP